jgi:hypothetical protein
MTLRDSSSRKQAHLSSSSFPASKGFRQLPHLRRRRPLRSLRIRAIQAGIRADILKVVINKAGTNRAHFLSARRRLVRVKHCRANNRCNNRLDSRITTKGQTATSISHHRRLGTTRIGSTVIR